MTMEYEKKQAACLLIAETLNPMAIRDLADTLKLLADEKEAAHTKRECLDDFWAALGGRQ